MSKPLNNSLKCPVHFLKTNKHEHRTAPPKTVAPQQRRIQTATSATSPKHQSTNLSTSATPRAFYYVDQRSRPFLSQVSLLQPTAPSPFNPPDFLHPKERETQLSHYLFPAETTSRTVLCLFVDSGSLCSSLCSSLSVLLIVLGVSGVGIASYLFDG